MYVVGNPVNYADPSGHWGFGWLKNIASSAWNGIKTAGKVMYDYVIKPVYDGAVGFLRDIRDLGSGVGGFFKDMGRDIGDFFADLWDKQWFRVTVYFAIIVAAIIVGIYLAPMLYAAIGITVTQGTMLGYIGTGMVLGALIGGTKGKIVKFVIELAKGKVRSLDDIGDFFKENWDWENALLGAAIGSVSGLFGPLFKKYVWDLSVNFGDALLESVKYREGDALLGQGGEVFLGVEMSIPCF